MKASRAHYVVFLWAAVVGIGTASPGRAQDTEGLNGITAVNARVADDYVRTKLPNGKFKAESYVFGPGGKWGGDIKDASADTMTFLDVAHVIAPPLASRSYLPAKDPASTQLLIMVYWGTTAVPQPYSDSVAYSHLQQVQAEIKAEGAKPSDSSLAAMSSALLLLNMENHERDRRDFQNAGMLGYNEAGLVGTSKALYVRGTAFGVDRDDLYTELEENRYFIVLMAYDFQVLYKQKKHKLLWETRFSINERHNVFDKALPRMADYAAQYFGQSSHGLVRNRVKEGRVDIGDPTVIEFLSNPTK